MTISRKLFLTALTFLVLALVSFLFYRETILGILRQKADEKAAEAYLTEMLAEAEGEDSDNAPEKTENPEPAEEQYSTEEESENTEVSRKRKNKKTEKAAEKLSNEQMDINHPDEVGTASASADPGPNDISYVPITDENYYERGGVVYTPEYARGFIDCVLEIPCIQLKRCVYSGTPEEIEADLDMWFTVSASPDLIPGKTHYAIYGHNHTVQNLSFNRLGEVKIGDWFTLTRGAEVYIYLVTDLFASERRAGRAAYAYDESIDASLCYIFTCGRDYMLLDGLSTRYKDFIVEGTLWRTVSLAEWTGENEASPHEERGEVPAEELEEKLPEGRTALQEALKKAGEEIVKTNPSPVITLIKEQAVLTDDPSGPRSPFSFSMLLVGLTGVFTGISLICFAAAALSFLKKAVQKGAGIPDSSESSSNSA